MDTVERLNLANKLLQDQAVETQKELRKSQHVVRQIAKFSSQLGTPVALNEIYRNCLHLFKDLLHLDFTTLFLVNDTRDGLVIYDTLGFPESIIRKFTVCRGVGLPGLVFTSEQLETVEDFHTEKRFSIPDIIFQNNIQSAIAVPMMHNKKLFGVIIGHTLNKILFSEEEQLLAEIFANLSATAIKNATHIQSLNISEQKLKQRTNEIETIFANSMVGIILLKGDRMLTRCNQKFADFMCYDSPEEMQGKSMRQFHLSDERYIEAGKKFHAPLVSGEQIQVEYQLRKKDGQALWCSISGKAIDHNFPPDLNKGVVWIVDDISQRKKMEEQLLKNQKLESIEILTGGLAHDFNNIITAILGNISLSLASVDPESSAYSFLLPAKKASLQAKDLTRKLQTFSQESVPDCHPTSLDSLLIRASAESFLAEHSVHIQYEFEDELWQTEVDNRQISKVIRSLLKNCEEAMAEGGDIFISCSNFQNNDELAELKAKHYVKTTITDTGHGISSAIIDKIFDPYFTTRTRDSNKGRGLGLATVHSIIKRHKGFISVISQENNGATVTLYLVASPDSKPNVEYDSGNQMSHSLVNSKGRVLVMDDNQDIRELIQQMLILTGYEVEVAVDGDEAIRLYRANLNTEKQFDVVMMDLTIPHGMGGADAVQILFQLDRNVIAIVSSGDPLDPVMENFEQYGFAAAISKPFDFAELHKTLSSVLNCEPV